MYWPLPTGLAMGAFFFLNTYNFRRHTSRKGGEFQVLFLKKALELDLKWGKAYKDVNQVYKSRQFLQYTWLGCDTEPVSPGSVVSFT